MDFALKCFVMVRGVYLVHCGLYLSRFHKLLHAFLVLFVVGVCIFTSRSALAAKCLYVSSYHVGYEWNDGIERGIERTLAGKCELDKFYMDSKRNKAVAFGEKVALAAKAYIEKTKPDVVIACDDNASKYLIKPHYKNAAQPFVFCGINWTVEPYGYPYSNVTGMVEIAPVKALIKELKATLKQVKYAVYLAPDVITEHREYAFSKKIYAQAGIEVVPVFVRSVDDWEAAFKAAQKVDFIILGSEGGFNDWDDKRAYRFILENTKIMTVANYAWMAHLAVLSMTKSAEEQGEWAAQVALGILGGKKPSDYAIVPNRRWNIFINLRLADIANIKLPSNLVYKAVRVGE